MAFVATAASDSVLKSACPNLVLSTNGSFEKAKAYEIDAWLKTPTVERILRHKIPPQSLIWKPIEDNSETPKSSGSSGIPAACDSRPLPKQKTNARLVILGVEDPLIDQIRRDSPTLSRDARMLALQYICSRRWQASSFDIKTAILRGRVQSDRMLGLEPPDELRERLKLRPDEVCRLLKGVYGLVNAPYLWYQELSQTLLKLNFQRSPLVRCLFVLVHPETHEVCGIVGIHVDDGICGGNQFFDQQLACFEAQFPFGSHKVGDFKSTGIHVKQSPHGSISLDQAQHVRDIDPISIPRNRRLQRLQPVNEEEHHACLHSLEACNMPQSTPDLTSAEPLGVYSAKSIRSVLKTS